MPKVAPKNFRLLLLLPAAFEGKQIMMKHSKVAVNSGETYAMVDECLSIGSTTVCPEKSLQKMDENSCIPMLLKGGQAR